MASRIIRKLTSGTGDTKVTVYGDPAKMSALCGGFTAEASATASNIQVSRAGGSVKQYPGDSTPFNRGATSAVVIKGGVGMTATLPGRPFTVEVSTGTGPDRVTDVTQMTLVGSFTNLHAKFVAGATKAMVLRSPGGRPYSIADPTP
jgi:hypothetical protein